MNVGDLVTLSARGAKLEACWKWTRPYHSGPIEPHNLVGLIVSIEEPRGHYNHERKYAVRWIGGNGPKSRETWGFHRNGGHWHRTDLKFVAKAK